MTEMLHFRWVEAVHTLSSSHFASVAQTHNFWWWSWHPNWWFTRYSFTVDCILDILSSRLFPHYSEYCCTVISSLFHGKWISNLCSQYISTNIYRYCILFFLSNFLIQYILPLSVSWHIDYLPWASMGHYTVYTMAILIGPESAWIIPLHKWLINLLVSPGFQVGCPIYKWVNQLHMHDIAIYRWYSHLWMIYHL